MHDFWMFPQSLPNSISMKSVFPLPDVFFWPCLCHITLRRSQQVDWLEAALTACHYKCAAVYGRMDQLVRNMNVTKFRNKQARVLLVTDVAARGMLLKFQLKPLFPFMSLIVLQCMTL